MLKNITRHPHAVRAALVFAALLCFPLTTRAQHGDAHAADAHGADTHAVTSAVTNANAHAGAQADGGDLNSLMSGNERFVAGRLRPKQYGPERTTLAQGQHPYVIVVACSDSRVPPEIVFDESLGKLFVVRTAGHVVDPVALGSIEYAVEHLHVSLILFLGHENCGAVKATISGGEATANVRSLLTRIKPAVEKVMAQGLAEKDVLAAAVRENVRFQMQKAVFESEVLGNYVRRKKLSIVGGVYGLRTGRVEMLSTDLAVERTGREALAQNAAEAQTHGQPATPTHTQPAAPIQARHAAATHAQPAAGAHAQPGTHGRADTHARAATRTHAKVAPAPHGKTAPARTHAAPTHARVVAHAPAETHATQPAAGPTAHQEDGEKVAAGAEHEDRQHAPAKRKDFAGDIREAYENKFSVFLKKTMLMRDDKDRCAAEDCRSIPAGELVRLDSPLVLNVMGRPQLRVRYKGRTCYILADPDAFEIVNE